MTFSARSRYLLVTAAVLTASVIQLFRGYSPMIVSAGAAAYLFAGNTIVYLSGTKQRTALRQQKRNYWAGN